MDDAEHIAQLEDMVKALATKVTDLQHLVLVLTGLWCTCDACAPTPEAKAERLAMTEAFTASRN